MKVPIELIRQDHKFAFDTSDIHVPTLPIFLKKSKVEEEILATFAIRVKNAESQMLEVEDFILTKIKELDDLEMDEQYLDNSELMAMLDLLKRVVDEMSDVRSLLASAINKYISLSGTIVEKNAQMQGVENSAEKIETRLKEEIEKLRESTEMMFKSRAYYKTLDISLLEFLNLDAGLQIDKIITTLMATLTTLAEMRLRANKVKITIIEIEDLLYVYECWAQQLKVLATKLLELFGNLFLDAQKLWMHLISGSYIRGGANVRLNRNCTKITVNATRPELTECEEPKFLNTPSAEFNMPEAQEQYCPPCISTTTTTTTTQKPPDQTTTQKPPDQTTTTTQKPTTTTTLGPPCEIIFTDFNDNKIVDDDLEFFINGNKVTTFLGTTDAKTTYRLSVPSGTVKLELKFKKPNGRNTYKEFKAEYVKSGAQIFFEQLSFFSTNLVPGDVVWSKTINVRC